MASTKVSALQQITTTSDDDLLLISNTLDAGTTYATRAIKVTDLLPLIDEDNFASDSDSLAPTQQSVKAYVDTKVSDLVGTASAVLDTLQELADALGGDENFATTVANQIGTVASDLATEAARITANEANIASVASINVTQSGRLDALETAQAGTIDSGDNVNGLIGNTSADLEPASWLFLVVDATDGSIKAIDKTFIEVE